MARQAFPSAASLGDFGRRSLDAIHRPKRVADFRAVSLLIKEGSGIEDELHLHGQGIAPTSLGKNETVILGGARPRPALAVVSLACGERSVAIGRAEGVA